MKNSKSLIHSCSVLLASVIMVLFYGCSKDPVEVVPDTEPKLIVSPDSLIFSETDHLMLYLTTNPPTRTTFQITSVPEWIEISYMSGIIDSNIVNIYVQCNLESNAPGVYSGHLVILSPCGQDSVFVKGFVGEYTQYFMPDTINISEFADSVSFSILNQGNTSLDIQQSVSNDYVVVDPAACLIPAANRQKIGLTVHREGMETGDYSSDIFVTINNDIRDTIHVQIKNFKEKKQFLTTNVIDAEYSRERDRLFFISTSPSSLNVYNPNSGIVESIPLSYPPLCISVSFDGNKAVVGHDGHLSYVDLVSKTVIKTCNTSCAAFDIVYGNNGWAYVFPTQDQWTNIHCVDLSTCEEKMHTGYDIYDCTKARLHPSGKYIYGADNGISPSDIEKYDIRNEVAQYMYDSPYHGDYPMSGDLWFSEDGERIFTRGKTVLTTSEIQGQDMLCNGSIPLESGQYGYGAIEWLDHSQASENLYILSTGESWDDPNKPFVFIHNANNLVFKSKIALEKYLVPDGHGGGSFYEAEPYFVFCNSSGYRLIVLTKAIGSGMVHEWAVQKFDVR